MLQAMSDGSLEGALKTAFADHVADEEWALHQHVASCSHDEVVSTGKLM